MLVDPEFNKDKSAWMAHALSEEQYRKISTGLFETAHHNFDCLISKSGGNLQDEDEWTDHIDWNLPMRERFDQLNQQIVPFYGVCDSVEQFLKKFGSVIEESSDQYCVSFSKIVKNIPAVQGGWRWHKWGEYVGEKDPQHEYLDHEDDSIMEVYCFAVYKKKK